MKSPTASSLAYSPPACSKGQQSNHQFSETCLHKHISVCIAALSMARSLQADEELLSRRLESHQQHAAGGGLRSPAVAHAPPLGPPQPQHAL